MNKRDVRASSKWTADIGTWEHGRNVELHGVACRDEAVKKAWSILENIQENSEDQTTLSWYVVQVFKDGRAVWDYMNEGRAYKDC